MDRAKLRIAITGATGLLGRNLLFEIIKQNINNLENLELIILGRDKKAIKLKQRISEIFIKDGLKYLSTHKDDEQSVIERFNGTIKTIHLNLVEEDLGLSKNDLDELKKGEIKYFFHLAALSDFRSTSDIIKRIKDINVDGTKKIIRLIKQLDVKEFIFTGSAYSVGKVSGEVYPSQANERGDFRNPYEKSKLEAENYIKQELSNEKIKYRIYRPTGIGGRLIEEPIGAVCKYDIFYGWAAFFLRYKMKELKNKKDIFNKTLSVKIRIQLKNNIGMNVVPVDYAAKIIWAVSSLDYPGEQFHLVNDADIDNNEFVQIILDKLGIQGYELVEEEPKHRNTLEKFYYKTVGQIFTPYVIYGPIRYNTDNLKGLLNRIKIRCPLMTGDNFGRLIDYAKEQYFGLDI